MPNLSHKSRWWFQILFIFHPYLFGEDSHFDSNFSNGLKPPTRNAGWFPKCAILQRFFWKVVVRFNVLSPWTHFWFKDLLFEAKMTSQYKWDWIHLVDFHGFSCLNVRIIGPSKSGYFEDPSPAFQVSNPSIGGSKILREFHMPVPIECPG